MKNTMTMTETINNTLVSLANQFASNPVEFNELINTITEEIDCLQAHFDKREEDLKVLSDAYADSALELSKAKDELAELEEASSKSEVMASALKDAIITKKNKVSILTEEYEKKGAAVKNFSFKIPTFEMAANKSVTPNPQKVELKFPKREAILLSDKANISLTTEGRYELVSNGEHVKCFMGTKMREFLSRQNNKFFDNSFEIEGFWNDDGSAFVTHIEKLSNEEVSTQ